MQNRTIFLTETWVQTTGATKKKRTPEAKRKYENRRRLLRLQRIMSHCCDICGGQLPPDAKKKACDSCRERRAQRRGSKVQRVTRTRAAARKLGLCINHVDREAVPGRSMCDPCLEAHSEVSRKWFLEKRAQAMSEGKCNICFKGTPAEGYKSCPSCREKDRRKKLRAKQKREAIMRGVSILKMAS